LSKHWELPRLIAHRGAPQVAPENTLAALRKAAEMGAKWVEFDVKLTRDHHAIIIHDEKLSRTTNGQGAVSNTSWEVISRLDAGSWFSSEFEGEKIPTLSNWLKECAELGLGINLEMKGNHRTANLLAQQVSLNIARYWRKDLPPPLISSVSTSCLKAIHSITPEFRLGLVASKWKHNTLHILEQLHCDSLHIYHKAITRNEIDRVKTTGRHVLAYTVNDKLRATELLSDGIEAIFSDNPNLLDGS